MQTRWMARTITETAFAAGKMAFVSGPRQAGKTTLAKALLRERRAGRYATWDDVEVRRIWARDPKLLLAAPTPLRPLLVLDEIHKARLWKRSLKGLWDVRGDDADVLVTGSARLTVYRKGSDSLMGRYFHFRLHPFSVRELLSLSPASPDETVAAIEGRTLRRHAARADEILAGILRYGAFPEPFLAASDKRARLWRAGRVEKVVHEDLRDLTRIPELSRIEMLAALLPERVGSLFSVASLQRDLEVSHDTVTRWLGWLRELYYVFDVRPFTGSLQRSLRKEGKLYLWDHAEVPEPAARFENLVACHLLKACDAWTDAGEGEFSLRLLRDKEKREIDFLLVRDRRPFLAVEVKLADTTLSPTWRTFLPQLKIPLGIQIVRTPGQFTWHDVGSARVLVASAAEALSYLA